MKGRVYDPQPGEPSYIRPDALPPPPTRVVNIRLAKYDQYIGRNHKAQVPETGEGMFGNPFTLKKHGRAALDHYRQYLLDRVERDPDFRTAVLALRGKVLGCFCVKADGSGECHGKILAAWIDAQPR